MSRPLIVRMASTVGSAAVTGATAIPQDDSIPAITEGAAGMSLSFVASEIANELYIDVWGILNNDVDAGACIITLHDGGAAIAIGGAGGASLNDTICVFFLRHIMNPAAAGTSRSYTSRQGTDTTDNVTLGGIAGEGRGFGAIPKYGMSIMEVRTQDILQTTTGV